MEPACDTSRRFVAFLVAITCVLGWVGCRDDDSSDATEGSSEVERSTEEPTASSTGSESSSDESAPRSGESADNTESAPSKAPPSAPESAPSNDGPSERAGSSDSPSSGSTSASSSERSSDGERRVAIGSPPSDGPGRDAPKMKGVESRENPGGPDETPEVADRGSSSSGSRPSSPPLERGEQGAPSPGAKQRRGGPPSGVPREGVRSAGDLSSGTNKQRQILAKAKRAFMNGSMSDAEPHFETLVDTGPFSGPKASAFIALSQIYINSGRPEQAIELLKRVPATGEEVVEVHLVRARAFGQAGNKKEAIEEYEHLIEMQPNYLFVYSSLGALYEQAGRQEKSKQLYKTYEKRLKSMFDTVTKPEQSKAIARMNTLDILALVDDKRAREAARKGLQDPEPKVRAKAAQTLYQMKATSARSDLEKVAEHDSNKRVREAARTALQRLSSKGGSPPAGGPR